jgi:small GTP-binding protein
MQELPHYKMTLLGDAGVGKSSLVYRLTHNNNTEGPYTAIGPTIGAAFVKLTIPGKCVLEIWDTAGAERYQSTLPMYARGSDIILAVYDIGDEESLNRLITERKKLLDKNPELGKVAWILVGNKMDLPYARQQVSYITAQQVAEAWAAESHLDARQAPALHVRVSAKSGDQMDTLFKVIERGGAAPLEQRGTSAPLKPLINEPKENIIKLGAETYSTTSWNDENLSSITSRGSSCCNGGTTTYRQW